MSATIDLTGPLSEHPFLAGMGAERVVLLNRLASAEVVPAGAMMFREGDPASRLYLVRHGRVSLEVGARARHGIPVDSIGDGEVLGWSWLLPPYRWAFDARAVQLVQAISIDAAGLRAEMKRDPVFGMDLLARMAPVMGRRLAEARHCIVDHVLEPAIKSLDRQ